MITLTFIVAGVIAIAVIVATSPTYQQFRQQLAWEKYELALQRKIAAVQTGDKEQIAAAEVFCEKAEKELERING